MAQTDITPSTTLGGGSQPNGLHIHVSNGASASKFDNPTDVPAPPKSGTATTVKIAGTQGAVVRYSNPS